MAFREPNLMKEIADRTRRIETRMTKWLAEQGFETGGRKPVWDAEEGVIEAPNAAVSLIDCVAAIQDTSQFNEIIPVTYDGQLLGYVVRP